MSSRIYTHIHPYMEMIEVLEMHIILAGYGGLTVREYFPAIAMENKENLPIGLFCTKRLEVPLPPSQ